MAIDQGAARHQLAYREHYPHCQYSWALAQFGVMSVPWDYLHLRPPRTRSALPLATELDHIYGKRGPCEQHLNYMMAHPVAHMWKTDHTTLGRIVAIWCKVRLQTDGDSPFEHFDPYEIHRLWGRRPLGMLQVWRETTDLPRWADLMVDDAIEMWDAEPTEE